MSERKGLSLKNCGSVPWHENPEGNQSPIGSIVESVKIDAGIATGNELPALTIQVRLMGNVRDGRVELTYRGVHSYSLEGFAANDPMGNTWIQDTLELRKTNVLKHKVTLTGGNWSIEADDVDYVWEPWQG
jgi:hypothetical protein